MLKAKIFICSLSLLYCLNLNAQNKDSIELVQATENFVKAFNSFDWTNFRNSFTEEATIFFPFWEQGRRKEGKKDIEAVWLEIFPEFLKNPKNDSLLINPKDIHLQIHGETAIVSFHLGDGINHLSRRTLVLINQNNKWKIAHLHASSVEAKNNN